MEHTITVSVAILRSIGKSIVTILVGFRHLLSLAPVILGSGVFLGWLAAFFLDWACGWTGGYFDNFPETFSPSHLWPITLSSLLLAMLLLYRAISPVSGQREPGLDVLPAIAAGLFLFYLMVHGAYALLWPSIVFTLFLPWALLADQMMSSPPTMETTTTVANAGLTKPAAEQKPGVGGKPYDYPAVKARTTFSDVDGHDAIKVELLKFGNEALLTDADIRKIRRSEPGKQFRNGALLSGEPGNGKTFMTECLAGSLGIPLITVTIGNLQSMWVGQKTERMVQAFKDAEAQAPCLLFIDEFDALLGNRDRITNPDSEDGKTVAAVLTEAVRIRGKGVVLVAATNYPDRLDAAGSRDGRFDLKLTIAPPDYAGRMGLLRRAVGKEAEFTIGSLEMAARHFEGFSTARLQAIGREVRTLGDKEVTFTTLLKCLRKVQGVAPSEVGPDLKELVLMPKARNQIDRLVSMMNHIEKTERMGGAIQPGVSFFGPPGTGKTATAMAIAKATSWTFIPATGKDLVGSDDAMEKIIAKARDMRPAIVFIDEADDILADRNYSQHTRMATNKLLSLMDGAGGRIPDVLFIAATNNPQLFDSASNRRLPIKIEFELPGLPEIRGYVEKWMRCLVIPIEPTFTVDLVAKILEGKSIADIKSALQEAINIVIAERERNPARGLRPGDVARAARSLSA
ncbi:MAG: ATP-binding protein [Georgfuchsia sp.]